VGDIGESLVVVGRSEFKGLSTVRNDRGKLQSSEGDCKIVNTAVVRNLCLKAFSSWREESHYSLPNSLKAPTRNKKQKKALS